MAGVSEKSDTLGMAGERGWWPISINFVPTRVLKTHWQGYSDAATKAGRTPNAVRLADLAHDPRRRHEREGPRGGDRRRRSGATSRGYFIPLLGLGRGLGALKVDPSMPDDAINTEYMIDNDIFIVGDPDDRRREAAAPVRRGRRVRRGAGAGADWPDFSVWDRSMTLLATEVMPKLADLTGEAA